MLVLGMAMLFMSYLIAIIIVPLSMVTMYLAIYAIIVMSMNHNQKIRSIKGCGLMFFQVVFILFMICCVFFSVVFFNDMCYYMNYYYGRGSSIYVVFGLLACLGLASIQGATFISYIVKYKAQFLIILQYPQQQQQPNVARLHQAHLQGQTGG